MDVGGVKLVFHFVPFQFFSFFPFLFSNCSRSFVFISNVGHATLRQRELFLFDSILLFIPFLPHFFCIFFFIFTLYAGDIIWCWTKFFYKYGYFYVIPFYLSSALWYKGGNDKTTFWKYTFLPYFFNRYKIPIREWNSHLGMKFVLGSKTPI